MQINQIYSTANPLVKKVRGLAKGTSKPSSLFLIEGRKLLEEAYAKNLKIAEVIACQSFVDTDLKRNIGKLEQINTLNVVDDRNFKDLFTTVSSCGIIALAQKPEHKLEDLLLNDSKQPLIIAEQIQDPGNLGTMIRTAQAFDAKGLILSKGTVDHFNPKVVRASMGAIFHLPIAYGQDMEACLVKIKGAGLRIIALDAKGEQSFWLENTSLSTAYVFGNEGNGLSSLVLSKADKILSIPISSQTESLNVAVAMGIVLCHTKIRK